jgi:hypothetical protein
MTGLRPPTGAAPPREARLADRSTIDLQPLAEAVCTRYQAEFPDEHDRYGPAGRDWCVHDNQYIFAWAICDAELGYEKLDEQIEWLARVLAARDFPLERLARNLEIAGEVLLDLHPQLGSTARALAAAAADVRLSSAR